MRFVTSEEAFPNMFEHLCNFTLPSGTNFSSQIFYYTRCITSQRVTSLLGPSPYYCARATHLFSKKCCSSGKWLATLSDLTCPRLKPPVPETNALPIHQLVGNIYFSYYLEIVLNFHFVVVSCHFYCNPGNSLIKDLAILTIN